MPDDAKDAEIAHLRAALREALDLLDLIRAADIYAATEGGDDPRARLRAVLKD